MEKSAIISNYFLVDNMDAFELLENNISKINSRTYKSYYKNLYEKEINENQYNAILQELNFINKSNVENLTRKIVKSAVRIYKKKEKEIKKTEKDVEKKAQKVQKDVKKKEDKKQIINNDWVPFVLSEIDEPTNTSINNIAYSEKLDEYNQFHRTRFIFKNSNNYQDLYNNIIYTINNKFYTRINQKKKKLTDVIATLKFIVPRIENGKKIDGVRMVSINTMYLENKETFINRINAIMRGDVHGSDAQFSEITPIMNEVVLSGTLFM